MTDIREVLEKVGFEDSPENYESKEIKLRDGRDAILWVNKNNGHGILDPEFWIGSEEYEGEYRENFSANLNSKTSPEEHAQIYYDLNCQQYLQFSPFLKFSTELLEIGSSFGGVLDKINRNHDIIPTSIEPNKEDAEYIKKKFGDRVEVHNEFFTSETDLGKKFDMIVSFEVLEHIEKPNDFIQGIYNNLKPGGRVNIEVPNHHDSMLHIFKNKAYADFYYHKAHIHYFTPKSLEEMFAKHDIVGVVDGFQMYPATNQLYWMFNDGPQPSAIEALRLVPECVEKSILKTQLEGVFHRFIMEYSEVINDNLASDCLVFKGMKGYPTDDKVYEKK